LADIILTMLAFFFIGGGIISAIILTVEYKKHRPVKAAACADDYITAEETQMTVTEDSFLRTHTTRVKVAASKKR
jgi:predicted neutral ceramidase superfamily lipid hydrolase